MDAKDKIEVARRILDNAVKMNISKGILLKISQKIDKYIVEYYWEKKNKRVGN
ncbi:aspartyl-phosphate phosphatase Spo0E family protein [Moorella naiadis]|uniref:aspartyl-phosphate phosphatase Spo0E family protein n=1 Tax=Moorella naiadis (nom. illeg.) TaxID=3093670 RepID=UPI003D9C9DBF